MERPNRNPIPSGDHKCQYSGSAIAAARSSGHAHLKRASLKQPVGGPNLNLVPMGDMVTSSITVSLEYIIYMRHSVDACKSLSTILSFHEKGYFCF